MAVPQSIYRDIFRNAGYTSKLMELEEADRLAQIAKHEVAEDKVITTVADSDYTSDDIWQGNRQIITQANIDDKQAEIDALDPTATDYATRKATLDNELNLLQTNLGSQVTLTDQDLQDALDRNNVIDDAVKSAEIAKFGSTGESI
jgi:hypothetical protein